MKNEQYSDFPSRDNPTPEGPWIDKHSWQPDLLIDSRPQPEDRPRPSEVEKTNATIWSEPVWISDYYNWLYQDIGGES